MKLPLSWLRDYVDVPPDPAALARTLIMAGVGIESIQGEVLELEITANRPDLLSILGVAREVGLLLGKAVKRPALAYPEGTEEVSAGFAVEVKAPDLCPRYTARMVKGVKVGPSPPWLAEKLQAAGLRPVNNVVDLTNFVLLETGQPLHAFDARNLRGKKIVVRRAQAGEKLLAIDAKEYGLSKEALVIADAERPVAIAGIMGGKESEITASTVDILLESAQFEPVQVRRTSRRLGLSTDSSYRFERGVDYAGVEEASRRAVGLLLELSGGGALRGALDVGQPPPARPSARVRPPRVAKVLGKAVSPSRVREILTGLGARVGGSDGELEVTPPPARRDLAIEADYIEEVARIEGYDAIPCDTSFPQRVATDNASDLVRDEIRSTLVGLGAYEVLTMSFAEAGAPNRVPYWTDRPPLALRDPEGNVDRTLRESLAPSLLKVLETNEAYKEPLHPVFEIAHIYRSEGKGYHDRDVLGLALPGDPLALKGFLETLFGRLGLLFDLRPAALTFLEPGRAAEIYANGGRAGYLGQAPPALSGLRSTASVAEIDFETLVGMARLLTAYQDFNRQPPVERDLSLDLPEAATWQSVEAALRNAAPPTLESTRFLSEYRGKGIEPGRKGWAFSMIFRGADRTLTGEEVDQAVDKIRSALVGQLGARPR
jgi:phenylalanyl-tRNA synthetase beta chain